MNVKSVYYAYVCFRFIHVPVKKIKVMKLSETRFFFQSNFQLSDKIRIYSKSLHSWVIFHICCVTVSQPKAICIIDLFILT